MAHLFVHTEAFSVTSVGSATQRGSSPRMLGSSSRRELLAAGVAAVVLPTAAKAEDGEVKTTASGLQYRVVKSGTGGQPKVGDLVVVRFKGSVKATGAVFDDIMANPEGYYFRLGRRAADT